MNFSKNNNNIITTVIILLSSLSLVLLNLGLLVYEKLNKNLSNRLILNKSISLGASAS